MASNQAEIVLIEIDMVIFKKNTRKRVPTEAGKMLPKLNEYRHRLYSAIVSLT